MDDAHVGRFLDLAYGAAADAALWPRVLSEFADLMGAAGGALVWQNQSDRSGQGIVDRIDQRVLGAYFQDFSRRHPSQRWMNAPRQRLAHFVPHIVADDDAMPKAELMKTAFYNEFMRPFDLHSVVRLGLKAEGMDAAFLMVARPTGRERFGEDEMRLARTLHGHLIRAFDLARTVGEASASGGAVELLRRAPVALMVVGADGYVVQANAIAEQLLRSGAGLAAPGRRLVASTAASTAALLSLIGHAASPDAARRRGGSAALPRADRTLPLAVTVAPLRLEDTPVLRLARLALVCVVDPEAGDASPEERLRALFGLSPAEARVAALICAGVTPKEAAERLGVSFFTVRAHLVRIFEKTGAGRQAELVRMVSRLGLLWPEDEQ